jgi:hypothetical protein
MAQVASPPARRSIEILRSIAYSLRYFVNAYPALYSPLVWLRHRGDEHWVVGSGTDLVIEGMGRSGNTFAVDAFQSVQSTPVRLVHHTHSAAQVIRAARLGRPALVIVRDPAEVVVSQMILRGIGAGPPLRAWIRFHRRLLPFRHRIVVATFEDVTSDLGAVIHRVNDSFGTRFGEFEHTPENVQRVFEGIEERNRKRFGGAGEVRWVAKPTAEREQVKREVRIGYGAPRLARSRARANAVYRALTGSVDH